MPFFTIFKKNKPGKHGKPSKTSKTSKKVTDKIVAKAGTHAQQHIQTHAPEYGDRVGAKIEDYAGRHELTRDHASQFGVVSGQSASLGLGVAGQYAANRQTPQYSRSNISSNNIGTRPAQAPRTSLWERSPESRPSQQAYSGGLGLRAPQAAGTTRLQNGNRTGSRIDVQSSQEPSWYESRKIRIAGEGESLVVQKDPARARRVNQY